MNISILPEGRLRYHNNDGTVAAGCKLYLYAAGTVVPKVAYRDSAGTDPHPHPITLDAKGETVAFGVGVYKIDVLTAAGAQVTGFPVDGIALPVMPDALAATSGAGTIGFDAGAVYAVGTLGRWLTDLILSGGASLIGFLQAGAGAVVRNIQERMREEVRVTDYLSTAQKADVAARTYLVDTTDGFSKAITRLIAIGGKRLIAPGGGYLLNGGAASPDGFKNGILMPDTGGDFTTANGITIIGDGVATVFKAGSANMVVLRASRLYSGGESFRIDGGSLANVWGLGNIPEDMTQITELVSHSYGSYRNVTIENCTEGQAIMPGPTVGAADGGCFYFDFDGFIFNNNVRDIWTKKDVTGAGNRVTRSIWWAPRFTRGNLGVQIDGGTELDFYSPNFELKGGNFFNYNDSNPANIRIFGGYAEACGGAIVSINPNQVQLFGFGHTSVRDASEFSMGRLMTGKLTVPKLLNTVAYMNLGGEGFVGFAADPDQDGSRTLALQINSLDKKRWNAAGDETFYGTGGTVLLFRNGQSLAFSATSASITCAGQLVVDGDNMFFRPVNGAATGVRLDNIGTKSLFPEVDNSILLGQTGFRWSAVWSANGTIQTSDARTKKDIVDSPLGLDFILALRPVAYRFKVGGNKVVGERVVTPAVLDDDGAELERAVTEPVIEQVPGKRQHFGFLTKNVKAAAGDVDFGGFIKTDMDDPESEEALRYDEFLPPLVRAVHELAARLQKLESK